MAVECRCLKKSGCSGRCHIATLNKTAMNNLNFPLFFQEAYTDCFLACKGGKKFPAHRVVLAMASPFFSTIFRTAPSSSHCNPCTLVLDDVNEDHLVSLLQYMYHGYSIIKCGQLASLSKTAKALGIKEFPILEVAPQEKNIQQTTANSSPNTVNHKNSTKSLDLSPYSSVNELPSKNNTLQKSSSANTRISQPKRNFSEAMEKTAVHNSPQKITKVQSNNSQTVSGCILYFLSLMYTDRSRPAHVR